MNTRILQLKRVVLPVLIVLLLSVAGLTNAIAQSFTVDNLNYTLNEDGVSVTVTGYVGTNATEDLVIPDSVEYYGIAYPVTVIGDDAFSNCGLTGSLTIGNSVHTIGDSAFSDCGFTGALTIPENVQNIGKYAFLSCHGFTSLYYNAINCNIEVEEYEEWYGEDEHYYWFNGMWLEDCSSMTTVVIGENVQTIPNCFAYYSLFTGELSIPESVTYIGSHAFEGCDFTGSLTIGNSVTSIESYAFNNCGFTGSLTIGNSVTFIGEYAFGYCYGITELNYNALDSEIGYLWLADVTSLTALSIGESVRRIPEGFISGNSGIIGPLTIPNSVTYIGDNAFSGCSGFTGSLTIPDSVTYIGYAAFSSCSGFTGSLTIPNPVTYIGGSAFSGCSGFTGSLTIPDPVTYIGDGAFSGCSGFSDTLTIGHSVTQIDNGAFFGACQGFTSFVVWAETPPSLGNNVFISADYSIPVYVPCGSLDGYQNASGWDVFANLQEINPCLWEITAEAIPADIGTVVGTGIYEQGQTCTLTAVPNEGIFFMNWTEDGVVVSTDAEYAFIVTGNRHLVAKFTDGFTVFIGDGGTTTNNILPSFSLYNYSLTQQIYTAAEIGWSDEIMGNAAINSVAFFNGGSTKTRNYDIYLAHTSKDGFNSNNDWVAVTESDKVFSGNVTIVSNEWTTISFDTPFAYNGTSNVVLIVDDNTGSYSGGMSCRIFYTEGSQAIRIYSDNTDYVPNYPYDYNGTCLMMKNQIVLGWSYIVSATVSPEQAGSVSGTGAYHMGEICTLTATPSSDDYVFVNWTENGEEVSTDAEYTFTVTDHRNLVANFLQYRVEISASVNPMEGGTITGTGNYLLGQVCTLTATPNEGCFFVNWTENGQEVSTDTLYSFTVTGNRTLVANFINPIGTVLASYYPDDMNLGSPYVGLIWNPIINSHEAMIGDEASTSNQSFVPFYTLYNYSISEALYTAAELAEAGVTASPMISLSWEVAAVTTNQAQNNISIWMANVPDAELTTTSHLASNMTLVYTGNIGIPSLGWNEFVFNEGSFAWDGTSNVLVLCQRNNGQWNGHVYWRSHTPGFNSMTYNYQDSAPYDVTTQTYAVTCSHSGRPNTLFKSTYNLENSISYKVYRTDCDSINYSLIADNVSGLMYVDSLWLQLPIGSYQYGVSAVDSNGNESEIVASNCIERSLYTYQIAAMPNFEERGVVDGAGEYALGAICTLTATPIGNNVFVRWTENGTEVSTEANYSFTVIGPRNLVALFSVSPDDIIVFADDNVKAICVNHWDTDGDGELCYDEAAAVTDLGYAFNNNQDITSFDELQYFTGLTSIGYNAFCECSSLTSIVIPEGVDLIDSYAFYDCYNLVSVNIPEGIQWIGGYAFYVCGLRGELTLPEPLEYVGVYAFYGCDGITTVNYNAINCQTMGSAAKPVFYDCAFTHLNIGENVQSIPNFAFKRCFMITDMTVAAVNPPTIYPGTFGMVSRSIPVSVPHDSGDAYRNAQYWEEFFNIIEVYFNDVQTINLVQGPNWFSTYLDITLEDLQNALVEALPGATSITIKAKTQSSRYNGSRWRGTLNWDVAQMYVLEVPDDCEIVLTGMPINPAEHPVTIIANGANWIGFPFSVDMTLEEAFSGFAVNGDVVKSKTGNARYTGTRWRASNFTGLEPGKGYIYQSNSAEDRTFTFPTGTK